MGTINKKNIQNQFTITVLYVYDCDLDVWKGQWVCRRSPGIKKQKESDKNVWKYKYCVTFLEILL